MNQDTLPTWRGIETILYPLVKENREPDPWVAYYVALAIDSVAHGQPNPKAIEMAELPLTERVLYHQPLDEAECLTTAKLRAAFETLPVPGGHPA